MLGARIAVVERACEAWRRRDFDVFREVYTEDVEADGGALWLEGGKVRGVEALVANYRKIISMFESNEVYPEAVIDGGDVAVVPLLWRGRPHGSEHSITQPLVGVFGFRGERICTLTWVSDLRQGLAAAGLPESAGESLVRIELPPEALEEPAGHA